MVLAQARLLPSYARLPFMPSTWAFTFTWAGGSHHRDVLAQ
jgi:tellurite resistance protein